MKTVNVKSVKQIEAPRNTFYSPVSWQRNFNGFYTHFRLFLRKFRIVYLRLLVRAFDLKLWTYVFEQIINCVT